MIAASKVHFGTEQAWLYMIFNWAGSVVDVDRVGVFGSRAKGSR